MTQTPLTYRMKRAYKLLKLEEVDKTIQAATDALREKEKAKQDVKN